MKKIIYIFLFTLVMISCDKDFIELPPFDTVSTDALYITDKDFADALVGVYAPLQSLYERFWQFSDLRADDVEAQHSANVAEISINDFSAGSNLGILESSWQGYYTMIFCANTLLSEIESADEADVPNKDQYIAETKFLRALAYFDLVRIFGGVPAVVTVLSPDEALEVGRASVDNIYNQIIIPDLLEAENILPVSYSSADVGRPTKGAAKSLLGKVYLTRHDFANAESKLLEVTTMGYALLEDFNDLWDYTQDEHHSEYIFDIEYQSGGLGLGSGFTNRFVPNMSSVLNFFGIQGLGGQAGSPTEEIFTKYYPGDSRKEVSVHHLADGLIDPNGDTIPTPPIDLSTYGWKYCTPISISGDSPANWKVIRYADVLLMLAEALNENGKTDQALTYLNMVHERADLTAFSGLDQTATRDSIYLERRLEFFLEGQRWFDLVRTGRALTVMAPLGIKDYMTVFPIPLSQIQVVNDPSIFPQNPGYD